MTLDASFFSPLLITSYTHGFSPSDFSWIGRGGRVIGVVSSMSFFITVSPELQTSSRAGWRAELVLSRGYRQQTANKIAPANAREHSRSRSAALGPASLSQVR